jgi:chemotaxis protein MotB
MIRKKKPPEHVNHERWLVSYADFITLLFAFFTTLYAISTVDSQKYGKMVMSMRASFESPVFSAGSNHLSLSTAGVLPPITSGKQDLEPSNAKKAAPKEFNNGVPKRGTFQGKSLSSIRKDVESRIGSPALGSKVQTRTEPRGLVISLGEGGFLIPVPTS